MTDRPRPLARHRLLSDGRSTALLTHDGEIDWWCWPRTHSEPWCWALLDPAGGRARWRNAALANLDETPAGPTARTTLRIGGRQVESWDALLPCGDTTELVRLVRAVDADLDVEHELCLGGFEATATWDPSCGSAVVHLGIGAGLTLSGGSTTVVDGVAVTRMSARRGEWAMVVLSPWPGAHDVAGVVRRMDEARFASEDRLGSCTVPHEHPDRVRHGLAVLHAMADRVTGAVVASPTTSLPEVVGGDRQFDYRYSWLRDSSTAVSVAVLLGHTDIADRYLAHLQRLGPQQLLEAPVRDADGRCVPDEREVAGVAGWNGSRPVRVGNGAASQLQYDALGFVVEAFFTHARATGRLSEAAWEIVRTFADRAAEPSTPLSHGIWEMRRPGDLVSADIGRWLTLDRAVRIARRHRPLAPRRSWRTARTRARQRVVDAILPDGSLPREHGGATVDASGLLVVVHRLLRHRDRRSARLVHATIRALGAGPFLYRYPPDGSDGFAAGESPFVPASWWAVTALAQIGDPGAQRRADELCAALPALMPEEFDPVRGEALGNTPLVWSHGECVRALFTLDASRRLRARLRRMIV